MPNLHNQYILAERKITQKNPEYTFPCSCSKNLSSFRLIIKQQWTIGEIFIFSNSSHLEWKTDLSDTILKGTNPRTIPATFDLIWFRGFRGEDLNVKVYDVRRTTDGRTTYDKWWQKLRWPLARWAKKWKKTIYKSLKIINIMVRVYFPAFTACAKLIVQQTEMWLCRNRLISV